MDVHVHNMEIMWDEINRWKNMFLMVLISHFHCLNVNHSTSPHVNPTVLNDGGYNNLPLHRLIFLYTLTVADFLSV